MTWIDNDEYDFNFRIFINLNTYQNRSEMHLLMKSQWRKKMSDEKNNSLEIKTLKSKFPINTTLRTTSYLRRQGKLLFLRYWSLFLK